MDTNSTPDASQNKFITWLKNSITARMFIMGILMLLLFIPLLMVQDLIRERAQRQKTVVSEINDKWGDEVIMYGPVLKIPYRNFREKHIENSENGVTTESTEEINFLYIFPEVLEIKSTIHPELKKRGIYQTAVYKSRSEISGNFSSLDIKKEDIPDENILWEKARMVFKTSNLKGVNEQIKILIGEENYGFNAKYQEYENQQLPGDFYEMESEILKNLDYSALKDHEFKMNISINGSSGISFIPIGKTTVAEMTSNWHTSSFKGNFLPFKTNKVTGNGIDAKWKILDINRPFPQVFNNRLPNLSAYAFGIDFMIPVDEYQKSERATKYGFLVIALTFLLFFLIQTLSKVAIHPFQYLMIGLGLVMFYTLLISISEHSSFLKAYLIAGLSVIIMISLYSKSILNGWKFPIFIGLSLTALYTFIYIIIQLENYALLVGSIGLFLILGGVMYVSRKIDWNTY